MQASARKWQSRVSPVTWVLCTRVHTHGPADLISVDQGPEVSLLSSSTDLWRWNFSTRGLEPVRSQTRWLVAFLAPQTGKMITVSPFKFLFGPRVPQGSALPPRCHHLPFHSCFSLLCSCLLQHGRPCMDKCSFAALRKRAGSQPLLQVLC